MPTLTSEHKILIGIPAYNEETAICKVLEDLIELTSSIDAKVDITVFDDGSKDKTSEVAGSYESVVVSRAEKNGGYGTNLFRIYDYAKSGDYDLLIVHDGDGQHDAANVISLLSRWEESGADAIIASRFKNDEHKYSMPISRKTGKIIWQFLLKAVWGAEIGDPSSGNVLLDKKVIADISMLPKEYHCIFFNFFMLAYFCKRGNRLTECVGVFYPAENCSMHSNLFKATTFFIKNTFYGLFL